MTKPSSLSDHHLEWEALVGRAILRFGDIELISIKCLALIPNDKIGDSAARLDFSRRANLLIELLEARVDRDASLNEVLTGIKRAQQLSSLRNLIAHNPVMLDIYESEDETDVDMQHSITSARSGNQTLDLAGLKEFAGEVDDLAASLWLAFSRVAGTTSHLWRSSRRRET